MPVMSTASVAFTGFPSDAFEFYDRLADNNNKTWWTAHKDEYLRRLKRIEGQARGLQRMVDEEQYCIDILTQVSAMTKALEGLALAMLDEHLSHCVVRAARAGGEEAELKLAEASAAIARLVRS